MGSKNSIAKEIVDFLPPADNFYDLFAGGCAITQAAIETEKYKNFYINDIDPNYYRSMLINQLMSKAGIEVIPAALWADRQTFSFCFDGMPKGGTFAVSTIGVKEDKECRNAWIDGFEEFLKKCEPDTILLYGGKIKNYDLSGLNIIEFSNSVTDRMKAEAGKNE